MKDFLYKFFKERSLLLAILTGLEIYIEHCMYFIIRLF